MIYWYTKKKRHARDLESEKVKLLIAASSEGSYIERIELWRLGTVPFDGGADAVNTGRDFRLITPADWNSQTRTRNGGSVARNGQASAVQQFERDAAIGGRLGIHLQARTPF